MTDPRCDHAWLLQYGGLCRYCGDHFPGEGEVSEFTRKERDELKKTFQDFAKQAEEKGFEDVAKVFKDIATK